MSWPVVLQLAVAVLLPVCAFAALSLHERAVLMDEGESTARRTVSALAEHTQQVIETSALVLRLVDARTNGMSGEEIGEDDALRRTLHGLAIQFPQIHSIRVADADGVVRASAVSPQTGRRASGLEREERTDVAPLRLGDPAALHIAAAPDTPGVADQIFTVSMRRTGAGGAFDGAISVSVSLAYFTQFWSQFTPAVSHVIPLIRSDGTLFVRFPAARHPARLGPATPFMQQIARAPEGGFFVAASSVDGVVRMSAYERVGSQPLYVSFSIDKTAWLAPWRERSSIYLVVALLMTMALSTAALLALRHARAQREASVAWRRAAHRSQAEMRRREKLEAQLLQSQKMEAVGQLTGGVAHDFNNLLHAIGLNVHLAQAISKDQPQLAKCLASIHRAVERAAQLTRQLTAFSRRQALEPRSFAPAELIVRMADLLHRSLGGQIQVEVDAGCGVHNMLADPGQSELAVLNLAVNARDAMPDGGRLGVRLRNVTVAGHAEVPDGDYVEFAIADTGTGMPADVAARAFEPFFTTKPVGKGTGLGLSMVHGFARQSGGTVSIESRLGHGTTVRLLLPRAPADGAPAMEPAAAAGPMRSRMGGRVLLVDDDSLVRNAMQLALAAAGYQVQSAASGAEALQALRGGPPDVLVTDFAMPVMNGLELASIATSLNPALKVIMVTGYADPVGDLGAARVHRLLHKPFHENELVSAIEDVLRREPSQAPLRSSISVASSVSPASTV